MVAGIEVRFTLTAKASQAEEDEMAELYTVRVRHGFYAVRVSDVWHAGWVLIVPAMRGKMR